MQIHLNLLCTFPVFYPAEECPLPPVHFRGISVGLETARKVLRQIKLDMLHSIFIIEASDHGDMHR